MEQAGKDFAKAVVSLIIGAASLVFIAVLLAVPQQDRSRYCTDFPPDLSCEVTISDLWPALLGAGVVALVGLVYGAAYLAQGFAHLDKEKRSAK